MTNTQKPTAPIATAPAVAEVAEKKAPAVPSATPTAVKTASKMAPKPDAKVAKKKAPTANTPKAPKAKAASVKTATAPAKKAPAAEATKVDAKPKKPKLVRDSFTIPKPEYLVLDELKLRALQLQHPIKKGELLRAGIKALASMTDAAFVAAIQAVPAIKTGRPAKD